jgi:putative NADPH-quinone reductase
LKDRQVSLKRSLLFALDQTRVERAERSARIIVTMGMPVLLYRWYFGAYGVRGFESSMLRFAGIKPIRESFFGLTFADEKKRARWIDGIGRHGRRGD